MKVKTLIKQLSSFNQDWEVEVCSKGNINNIQELNLDIDNKIVEVIYKNE